MSIRIRIVLYDEVQWFKALSSPGYSREKDPSVPGSAKPLNGYCHCWGQCPQHYMVYPIVLHFVFVICSYHGYWLERKQPCFDGLGFIIMQTSK